MVTQMWSLIIASLKVAAMCKSREYAKYRGESIDISVLCLRSIYLNLHPWFNDENVVSVI